MIYGHTPPEGIPQAIWDDAIDLWLNLSTADSDDIKTIADRLVATRKRCADIAFRNCQHVHMTADEIAKRVFQE